MLDAINKVNYHSPKLKRPSSSSTSCPLFGHNHNCGHWDGYLFTIHDAIPKGNRHKRSMQYSMSIEHWIWIGCIPVTVTVACEDYEWTNCVPPRCAMNKSLIWLSVWHIQKGQAGTAKASKIRIVSWRRMVHRWCMATARHFEFCKWSRAPIMTKCYLDTLGHNVCMYVCKLM